MKNEEDLVSMKFTQSTGWKDMTVSSSSDSVNVESVLTNEMTGNLKMEFEFPEFNPNEIELYLYITTNETDRPQMIFLQSSSINSIQG